MVPRYSTCPLPKILVKFQIYNTVHPNESAKYKYGRLKSAIFEQYLALSLSKRLIGTHALYQMVLFLMTLSDPKYLKPPQFLHFASFFISS